LLLAFLFNSDFVVRTSLEVAICKQLASFYYSALSLTHNPNPFQADHFY